MNDAEAADSVEVISDFEKPKTAQLVQELTDAIAGFSLWRDRADIAEDSSWCIWPGQSSDGKKHPAEDGDDVFPWDGASDTRLRFVEEKVREAVLTCNAGFRRGRWDVIGRETTDAGWGRKVALVLKWLVYTKMKPTFNRERKLALDWRFRYGASVTLTEWQQKAELTMQDLDLMSLVEMFGLEQYLQPVLEAGITLEDYFSYVENTPDVGEEDIQAYTELRNAMDLVMNPAREKEFVDTLKIVFPTCKSAALHRAVKQLRETGKTRLPQPSLSINRPVIKALKIGTDIFFPAGTRDLESARWVAVREWHTLTDIESYANHPDPELRWNAAFVKELKEHKGISSTVELDARRSKKERWKNGGKESWEGAWEDTKEMYEVITFYYTATDEYGINGRYKTVTSSAVKQDPEKAAGKKQYGWHGLLPYEHGRLPFTLHTFYDDSERILDQAGIPYLIYTYQNEIKEMRDMRLDAASISILPPVRRDVRDAGKPLMIGPNKPVYEHRRGSTEYMNPPNSRVELAVSAEQAIRDSAGRLVGSQEAGVPPPLVMLHQEDMVTSYHEEMVDVLSQVLQLAQQFLDEAIITRVTGAMPQPFKVSREEIQGQFDFVITFDPRELDGAFAMQKLDMFSRVVRELDVNNVVERNAMVMLMMQAIDPHVADQLIIDPEAGNLKELEEEQVNLALIMTGQEPPMKESGQNAKLRLQVLQAAMQNPSIVQTLQQDPIKAEIFDNRLKHFSFLLEQQENAKIGRVGAAQVLPQ